MATWTTFTDEAPDLAALARARIDTSGLLLLATIRSDGYPRISPLEPIIHQGDLHLGMMPNSTKALDLRREPKCALHTATDDKDVTNGDVKFWGLAREIAARDEKQDYADALEAELGHRFEPDEINLFAVDLLGASSVQIVGKEMHVTTWRPGREVTVAIKT
jgi:nitroimidazol reductase NimA-like FMN-containing flavoprotein (pyridoxamine 5'-phosphate oxidase superfamily)